MASAVPYDPDDEVDDILHNNPFEEPSNTNNHVDDIYTNDSHTTIETTKPDNAINDDEATQPKQMESEETKKKNAEKQQEILKKLIPERFEQKDKYNVVIKVIGLERVGSLSNKKENPTIIFEVNTNLPTFRKKNHKNVRKSLDEFRNLFKYLNATLSESFIPSLPAPFTNYGINTKEDYKKTVNNFQVWFFRLCANPLIIRNEELAFFIESDFDTYYPVNQYKSPVSGLKRKTMKQFAPPYDEYTELAEFRPLVKSIYSICDSIQERLLKASRARKLMVQDENLFGKCFEQIDDKNVLYKKYGRVMTAVGDIDSIIASMDMATFYDGLTWIVRDTYVVKEALTNRHFLMRELLNAQANTKNRQEQVRKTRTKRDSNPIKVEETTRNMKLAHQYEADVSQKLNRVTQNMLIERNEWLSWYDKWLKSCIRSYVLKRIEYERKKLALLERVRIDVRKADPRGGLSRLGRENVSDRTEVSQSLEGDSWAGERRIRNDNDLKKLLNTEFDETLERAEQKSNGETTLDARNAASLLGVTTF
ncbi:PX domain [Nakaseomyces glabratus]|nr:PX domain [Nakaseomyces glabratus]KAH7599511.1 PX domain [Nakaseomyces glabratus]KAH7612924.1 PX domain [Nakaseomyces glabratus]